LEGGLRIGGYGYPAGFFLGPDAEGIYTTNPQFGLRFFPRTLARLPDPTFIGAKSPGAVRIFVLGSSAARGTPESSFSFGKVLEAMLRERYPSVKFEVVNAAMTAINSHVCREIARDCAAHEPDLFIVYMGNNEVVGPYGPGTVFQQWSPSLRLIRANVWLKSTRTGQLFDAARRHFHPSAIDSAKWHGMEMFLENQISADDPRLATVCDNFRRNLTDICRIARGAKAGVILSTVAVNLRDCPPFASKHRGDLTPEDLDKWSLLYKEGAELEVQKHPLEAIERYEAAARIDDRFAELQFRTARCLASLGRVTDARARFLAARDLDTLRFRADAQINAAIRDVAGEQQAAGVRLVDAEEIAAQRDSSCDGIPGEDLFYEHVHFTFDGNYLLARSMLDRVCESLPQLSASQPTRPVPSRERCAQLLALTPWDELEMAMVIIGMTSRRPFTDQLDHAARQEARKRQSKELSRIAENPQALRAACVAYQAPLEKSPDDLQLNFRLAKLALKAGEFGLARERLKIVSKKLPFAAEVFDSLGTASQGCQRTGDAIAAFRRAIELDPEFTLAHVNLGVVLATNGRVDEAIAEYHLALKSDPSCAMAHYNLGVAFRDRGQLDEAIGQFRAALESDPELAKANSDLGTIFQKQGKLDEAIALLQKALQVNPNLAMAHNNLASCLRSRGQRQEAIVEFQKALAADPRCAAAHFNMAAVFSDQGRVDEAISHFQDALKIDPTLAIAHNELGVLLSKRGQYDEAIRHFDEALRFNPGNARIEANLMNTRELRASARAATEP
jgi:tetratricopeptide (TPR) repeat protein